MDVTAKSMVAWTRESIRELARDCGTVDAAHEALAKQSGLSASWIRKFYYGEKDNPTANTIDRLVAAIKIFQKGGRVSRV
jgi:transcriptional regulator with XRE-family HTH domain